MALSCLPNFKGLSMVLFILHSHQVSWQIRRNFSASPVALFPPPILDNSNPPLNPNKDLAADHAHTKALTWRLP